MNTIAGGEAAVQTFLYGDRPFSVLAGAVPAFNELRWEVNALLEAEMQGSYLVDGDDHQFFGSLARAMDSGHFESRTRFIDQIQTSSLTLLDEMVDQVRRWSGRPVICSTFISRPDFARFRTHVDGWDGLVVQLSGTKRWILTESETVVVVKPGDALLVRAGVPHHAEAVAGTSIHVRLAMLDDAITAKMLLGSTSSRPGDDR